MDALYHGRPLVCFESTTGIAEYLVHDPLASFGVVPLLDVEAAACRIFRLIEDTRFSASGWRGFPTACEVPILFGALC